MCRQGYRTGKTAEQTAWNIWSCATNISSTGLRKYKPPAGRKTRLRAWQLLMRNVKSAFALLLTKVTKHIPPQTSPAGLSLAGI